MSEFKGTKEPWRNIFLNDNQRAIRSSGGILMTFWKPNHYTGQDERFELEMKETQANQQLCSKAPEMLEMLKSNLSNIKKLESLADIPHEDRGFYYKDLENLIKEATQI